MKIRKRTVTIIFAPILLLAAITFGSTEYSFADSVPGMLAYWKLEEDASIEGFTGYSDETMSISAGLCSGSCPAVTSSGMVDSGQTFSGSDTGIDISATPVFDFTKSSNFSIELWFKLKSVDSREVLLGRGSTSSPMNWWIGVQPSGRLAFSLTSTSGMTELIESSQEKKVTNDSWHHAAVVRYADQTRLFVDGHLEASVIKNYDSGFESPNPINVGYLNNGDSVYHFKGTLDEIAIFNISLPEKDVRTHYYLSRDYRTAYDKPVRIMPLGDSITYDNRSGDDRPVGERTGYRWPLWNWLNRADFRVDFIGSEQAGEDLFDDPDNAAFPGISDTQIWELIRTGYNPRSDTQVVPGPYLKYYPNDVIMLHIGTNDLGPEETDVENILDEIDDYDPSITVVLAQIINRVGGSAITTQFNNNLEIMAKNRILNGDKIILVDMEYGSGIVYQLEPDGDMYDELHPTNVSNPDIIDSGYGKMADVWYIALDSFLPQPPPDCSEDALSLWTLDERSGDSFTEALNGNHGIGDLSPAPVVGKVYGAQFFNGTDTGINVSADDAFNWADDASFSIEFWIKKGITMNNNEVIVGRDDGASSQLHWWTGIWEDGKAAFVLRGSNGTGSGSRETGEYLEGNEDLSDGAWHHVAVVRDSAANENRLYVDGVLNDFVSITYDIGEGFGSATADLNLGWLNLNDGYHYTGTLDEIAIYNRVLTAGEIFQHFNNESSYCPATPPSDSSGDSSCFISAIRQ